MTFNFRAALLAASALAGWAAFGAAASAQPYGKTPPPVAAAAAPLDPRQVELEQVEATDEPAPQAHPAIPVFRGDEPVRKAPPDPVQLAAQDEPAPTGTPAPTVEPVADRHEAAAPPRMTDTVSISTKVVEAASAYETYLGHAGGLTGRFASASQVSEALSAGEAYEPAQLARGMAAYGALVALQDPVFVGAVRELAQEDGHRAALLQALKDDPASAAALPGAASAAVLVAGALRGQVDGLLAAGKSVKQAAYDVQKEGWSMTRVADPAARLARAKSASATAFAARPEDTARLIKVVTAARRPDGGRTPDRAAVIDRSLAVAALAILGEGGDAGGEPMMSMASDARTVDCLKMAKLNLYQCLSSAGPQYEDIFCLGEHALLETRQCLARSAGLDADRPPEAAPLRQAAAAPTAFQMPVGRVAAAQ